MPRSPHLTRRQLLAGALLAPMAGLPRDTSARQQPVLRAVVTSHPIQPADGALQQLISAWSTMSGVRVGVTIVPRTRLRRTISLATGAGQPFDMVCAPIVLAHRAEDYRDLARLADRAAQAFGPMTQLADRATLVDGKRLAISTTWRPAPMHYRRSLWTAVGRLNGPLSWPDMRETGREIRRRMGHSVGLGLAPEPGSERVAEALLRAFGGAIVDDRGKLALDSAETRDAIRFAQELYAATMTPESLAFAEDRARGLLAHDVVSLVNDSLAAYRMAVAVDKNVGADVFLAGPPSATEPNTAGSIAADSLNAWHIAAGSPVADAAEELVLELIRNAATLVQTSQLADHPSWNSTAPQMYAQGGWLDNDPYAPEQADRLRFMTSALVWSTSYGGEVPPHRLLGRSAERYVLARMFGQAVRGERSADEAIMAAIEELNRA